MVDFYAKKKIRLNAICAAHFPFQLNDRVLCKEED